MSKQVRFDDVQEYTTSNNEVDYDQGVDTLMYNRPPSSEQMVNRQNMSPPPNMANLQTPSPEITGFMGISWWWILLAVIVIVVVGYFCWKYYFSKKTSKSEEQ